jgi:hypothetical protein
MRFANGLPLPVRPFLGPSPHEVIWREADSARVRDILHNSAYAGACWGLCVWAPAKGSEPKRTRISAGWLWRIGRSCQRAAESPHFGAHNFPQVAGSAINRLSDRGLRFWAVDRGA